MRKARLLEGGCLCGSIRFTAVGPPLNPHTCSCSMCRRHTGAPTANWVEFPREAVRWTGPGGMPRVFRSSEWSSRAFCPTCGSSLGAIDDAPTIALLTGVFDKSGSRDLRPRRHSFRGGRPRWWHLDTDDASSRGEG